LTSLGANARYSLSFAAFTASFASPRCTLRIAGGTQRLSRGVRTLESVAESKTPWAVRGFHVLPFCTSNVFELFPALRTRWILLTSFVIFRPDFNLQATPVSVEPAGSRTHDESYKNAITNGWCLLCVRGTCGVMPGRKQARRATEVQGITWKNYDVHNDACGSDYPHRTLPRNDPLSRDRPGASGFAPCPKRPRNSAALGPVPDTFKPFLRPRDCRAARTEQLAVVDLKLVECVCGAPFGQS